MLTIDKSGQPHFAGKDSASPDHDAEVHTGPAVPPPAEPQQETGEEYLGESAHLSAADLETLFRASRSAQESEQAAKETANTQQSAGGETASGQSAGSAPAGSKTGASATQTSATFPKAQNTDATKAQIGRASCRERV